MCPNRTISNHFWAGVRKLIKMGPNRIISDDFWVGALEKERKGLFRAGLRLRCQRPGWVFHFFAVKTRGFRT